MKPLFTPVLLSLVTSSLSFSQITETKIPGTLYGFGHAVAIEADHLLVGSLREEIANSAYVFQRSGDEWTLSQTLRGRGSPNRFGSAVAVVGNTALVGSGERFGEGGFYTYEYDGATWQEMSLTMGGVRFFANSVSMDGNSALIGSMYEIVGTNSGAAIAYTTTDSGWIIQDTLTSDGVSIEFGNSVSLDDDFAIVGAHLDFEAGTFSGAAYIFQRTGTSWNQVVKLIGNDTAPADRFGTSVSLSGEYALVGAPFADTEQPNSGAAYVFKRNGSTWIEQAKLVAADRSFNDHFGISVSILGDFAVIGAEAGDGLVTNSGTAYIFKREGSSWNQLVELYASDGVEDLHFGNSVDISANEVVVGATGHYYDVDGAVYVYSGYAEAQASVAVSIDSLYQTVPPQGATFP